MADHGEQPSPNWGQDVAKWTFILTVVLAVLYVGAVFAFILK